MRISSGHFCRANPAAYSCAASPQIRGVHAGLHAEEGAAVLTQAFVRRGDHRHLGHPFHVRQ